MRLTQKLEKHVNFCKIEEKEEEELTYFSEVFLNFRNGYLKMYICYNAG